MVMRCQVVFPGRTGIPEDQFVNTYHIGTGQPFDEADLPTIGNIFFNAYNTPAAGQTNTPAYFYSRFIDGDAATIRVYDMDEGQPRTPYIVDNFSIIAQATAPDLPEEVALCMTIQGAPPITPRRRGRVYLGPLNTQALDSDTVNAGQQPSRPTTEVMQVFRSLGEDLMTNIDAQGWNWMIASSVPALNYVIVTSGYVDNAWDTQRRRGVDPTNRWRFPSTA